MDGLTPRQARYLSFLLQGYGKAESARLAGVSPRTARDWHRQPAFRRALQQSVDSVLQDTLRQLVSLLPSAVKAYEDALRFPSTVKRLDAATQLVHTLLKLRADVDLASRIEEIEDRLGGEDTP